MSDDIQHFQELQKEAKKSARWFTALTFGLGVCLIMVAAEDSSSR